MQKYFREYVLGDAYQHDYKSLFACVQKFEKDLFLMDFEFLGKQGSDFNFVEYEKLVLKNELGLHLDWSIWHKIIADTVQVINLLIVAPLSNESNVSCENLKETSSFFIECVDGYNWSVFTYNSNFFDEMNAYFVGRSKGDRYSL